MTKDNALQCRLPLVFTIYGYGLFCSFIDLYFLHGPDCNFMFLIVLYGYVCYIPN